MKMMGSKFNRWLNKTALETKENYGKTFFFGGAFIPTNNNDEYAEWEESIFYDKVFEYNGKFFGINFSSDNIEEAFDWYNKVFDYKEKLLSDEEISSMGCGKTSSYILSILKMLKKIDEYDYELLYFMHRNDISVKQKNKLLLICSLKYLGRGKALSIKQIIANRPEYTIQYIFFLIRKGYLSCEYRIDVLTKKEIIQIFNDTGRYISDGLKKDALEKKLMNIICCDDVREYISNKYFFAIWVKLSSKARRMLVENDGIFYIFENIFIKKYVLEQSVEKSYNSVISDYFYDYIITTGNVDCLRRYFIYDDSIYGLNKPSINRKLMIQWLYHYVNCYHTKELLLSIKRDVLLEKSLKKRTLYILDKLNHYFMDKEVNDDYNHFKHLSICPWVEAEKNIEELYSRDYAIRLFTLDEFKDLCYGVITNEMKFVTLRKKIYEKYFYFVQDALYRWNIMIDLDSYQLVIKEPLKINDPMRKLIKAIQKVK